jgi:hypothetical protein
MQKVSLKDEKKKRKPCNPILVKLNCPRKNGPSLANLPSAFSNQALDTIYGAEIMRRESNTFGQRGSTPFFHALSESFNCQ